MGRVSMTNSDAAFAAIILAVLAIFLVDIFTPFGITVGLFYILPTLYCLRSYSQRRAIVVAALSSVLLIVEVTSKSPGQSLLIGLINDSMVLVVIWASVFAGIVFVRVAQQVAAAKELQHLSEEQLRAVLNNAYDAIIVMDQRGAISDINPATERMFGYAGEELVGRNVRMLMPPPYCDEHDTYISRYLRTGEAQIVGIGREAAGLRKDGSSFPAELTVSPIDHLALFTVTIRDTSLRMELERQVLETAAEEQRRIGQELHDGTGQELTALALFASTLVDLLNQPPQQSTDPPGSRLFEAVELRRLCQTADRLAEGLVEANRHVQQLAHGIMPAQIDAEGLRFALEALAASTNYPPRVACRFDCPAPVVITSNSLATHLYRIAQEAVNNALRHSCADLICISFFQGNNEIVLEVCDNGIGFDPAAMNRSAAVGNPRGFGLGILNYRAGIIGGALRITRREEGGTLLKCTIPQEKT